MLQGIMKSIIKSAFYVVLERYAEQPITICIMPFGYNYFETDLLHRAMARIKHELQVRPVKFTKDSSK